MRYQSGRLKLGRLWNSRGILSMDDDDRQTHLYVVGATRTGKTKFLQNAIQQDILHRFVDDDGPGMLLLDPHGSLYKDVAQFLADNPHVKAPVLFVDPSRDDYVVPYHLLRRRNYNGREANPTVVVSNFMNAMSHVWGQDGTQNTPQFHQQASRILLTLYQLGLTVREASLFLSHANREIRDLLTRGIGDRGLSGHWKETDDMRRQEFMDAVGSTARRFEPFVQQERLSRMFGLPGRSLDFYQAMEEGWIILVNLSPEGVQIGTEDARVLGTVMLADLWVSALQRGKDSPGKKRPFHVYIDEVQNFITPTLARDLDQAAGYGLRLTLAHQFPSQLSGASDHGRQMLQSLMTNARSKVVFGGIGSQQDLEPLVEYMYRGAFDIDEIKHMQWNTKVMEFKTEMETAYSSALSSASGGSAGLGTGGGWSMGDPYDNSGIAIMNHFFSNSRSNVDSWSEGRVEGETHFTVTRPVLGREITGMQFRNLEEQRYRAMAAMFDQKQRHFWVRLASMSEPMAAFTPMVEEGIASEDQVDAMIAASYKERWKELAYPANEARRILKERERRFDQLPMQDPLDVLLEPQSYARRIESPVE